MKKLGWGRRLWDMWGWVVEGALGGVGSSPLISVVFL